MAIGTVGWFARILAMVSATALESPRLGDQSVMPSVSRATARTRASISSKDTKSPRSTSAPNSLSALAAAVSWIATASSVRPFCCFISFQSSGARIMRRFPRPNSCNFGVSETKTTVGGRAPSTRRMRSTSTRSASSLKATFTAVVVF